MLSTIYFFIDKIKTTLNVSKQNNEDCISSSDDIETTTRYKEENENKELENEIINNVSNKVVIRNYDQKIIKDIKIKEKNACYVTYPCLHDVIIIFDDNTYEETTLSIIVIYEIWNKLSFDINIKFLKHCKDEYNKINHKENLIETIFLNKYTIM